MILVPKDRQLIALTALLQWLVVAVEFIGSVRSSL
jgi:hypothetical protein